MNQKHLQWYIFQIKRTCTDSFEVNFFMVNHACMTEVNIYQIFNLHLVFNVFYCAFVIFNAVLGFHCIQLLKFSELKIPGSIFRCICFSIINLPGMHYLKRISQGHRHGHMCFCEEDECNSATMLTTKGSTSSILLLSLLATLLLVRGASWP